jgi:hypothetical protein
MPLSIMEYEIQTRILSRLQYRFGEVQYQIFLRHEHCRAHSYASLFPYKRGSFFGNSHRRNIVMSAKGKDIQNESFVSALWMAAEYGRNISNIVLGVNRGVRFEGVSTQKGVH